MTDDTEFDGMEKQSRWKDEVKLQYDSDSSLEDYKCIKKTEVKDKKVEDEEDDDMFASDNDDEKEANENNDESNIKSELEAGEFNLEELEKLKHGEEDEEDSNNVNSIENESEDTPNIDYYTRVEDFEEVGMKTKWAPQIEAFNLKKEADEGVFDKDGNYERTKDSEDEAELQDFWMDNMKKGDIKKASLAQNARKQAFTKRDKPEKRLEDLLALVSSLLQPVETPLEALSRQKDKLTILEIELLSEAITLLEESFKFSGVYEMAREEFMRAFQNETGYAFTKKRKREDDEESCTKIEEKTNEEKAGNQEDIDGDDLNDEFKIWEFQWIDDDQIHGPYSAYEMNHWKQNYFENGVNVRKVGEEAFLPVAEVDF